MHARKSNSVLVLSLYDLLLNKPSTSHQFAVPKIYLRQASNDCILYYPDAQEPSKSLFNTQSRTHRFQNIHRGLSKNLKKKQWTNLDSCERMFLLQAEDSVLTRSVLP